VTALTAIGDTSLVQLHRVVLANCARVFVKLEWENPTGSMKDRMATAVIAAAEGDGRLQPGYSLVEYTGGSTGASLAFVCAVKGYRIRIVSSDAFAREKLDQMAAYGAELTLLPSEGGRTTKKLILDMIEAARTMSREPRIFWTDQLHNADTIAGYHALGDEIWSHPSLVNEIIPVPTDDAKAMARRLAREEGLFAGTSSGANVLAAIRVGEALGPKATVVTLLCDSGLKYVNTDVYRTN
jgi:cysteine synthase